MPRTVTALYDSRADAETARTRFIAQIKTQSTRIIAKDTLAAVDGLDIDPKHATTYRDAVRRGCHLLVAEIEEGQDPKRIVELLKASTSGKAGDIRAPVPETPTYGLVGVTDEGPAEPAVAEPEAAAKIEATKGEERAPAAIARPPVQQSPGRLDDELRIGMPVRSRAGARVRSIVRETPTEEEVALSDEHVDVQHRASERRLSFEEVREGGLLQDRVFEIREMREEPVVTKEAFVREEVIVRKTVQDRTETIRDTVRSTDFEVEESPAADESGAALFGGRSPQDKTR